MRKLKSKVEIYKLPLTTPVFYRGTKKRASFSLVLVGAPRKESLARAKLPVGVTSWIAPGLPHAQVGLRCAFRQASPKPLPVVFTIKLPAKPSWALFPSVHGGGHTTKRLVCSRKTTSLSDVQQWCMQAPSDKRCANLTKH